MKKSNNISEKIAVVHYDEIALKGGNREHFEDILMQRIKEKLNAKKDCKGMHLIRLWGRFLITDVNGTKAEVAVREILGNTPGIATFGIGLCLARDDVNLHKMGVAALLVAQSAGQWQSFSVRVRRVDKTFEGGSSMLEREVGSIVYEAYNNGDVPGGLKNVDLMQPDVEIIVEILHKRVLVYTKEKSIGGLPVGSSGRAVALLSGGFDSPVAAYMLAKRGVRIIAVHFHGMPHTSAESVEKVKSLCRVLASFTGSIDLHIIPVVPAMKAIALEGEQNKLRLILLRRFMNRVAQEVALRSRAKALITGESVGQVASQTLENMRATAEPIALPVLQPLCGMNKQEIITLAKKIGTHDISVLPHDDTCSSFMPKKPETRANLIEVHEALATYDEDTLVAEALAAQEVEKFV